MCYKQIILGTLLILFFSKHSTSQSVNYSQFDNLIETGDFKLLEKEFREIDLSEYSYIKYLRNSASIYSQKKMDTVAVNIMQYCCDWSNSLLDDCDTIKLNNLHLLARYYSFDNNSIISVNLNLDCLKKRLTCENVDPIDIAKSYNNIGLYYYNHSIFDSSLVFFENSYKYLHYCDIKKSFLTPILFGNYLLNLTITGNIKKGKKLLNEWYKYSNTNQQFEVLNKHLSRNIYELLTRKELESAETYYYLNLKIIAKEYGKNSPKLIEYKLRFAQELGLQGYDTVAHKFLMKIDKKNLKQLEKYDQLRFGNTIATGFMNVGDSKYALENYLELKTKFFEEFKDSSSAMLLLSNMVVCYKNIGDIEKMITAKEELYQLIDKNKYKLSFQWIYERNLERDEYYYFQIEDYLKYEAVLLKAIEYYYQLGELDKFLYKKLTLSNLYLFQKIDIDQSERLLNEVKSEIIKSKNIEKTSAFFKYYQAEFYRRKGDSEQYKYYIEAYNIFESLRFYPIEYKNSMKFYAQYLFKKGEAEKGISIMDKYLAETHTTNKKQLLCNKIDYLNTVREFQSDEKNNKQSKELFNEIEMQFGSKNRIYSGAARMLNDLILDNKTREIVIYNWINGHDSERNFDYFSSKVELAKYFWETNKIFQCDSLWNQIINEAEILKKDEYSNVVLFYISNLIHSQNKGFSESLALLKKINIPEDNYNVFGNNYYLDCYIGNKEYQKAFHYLTLKEKYILSEYSENSLQYFDLINDFSKYFEIIENYNLEKYYREKEIDLYYKYQPENKDDIIRKTSKLAIRLNMEFHTFNRSLELINKAKKKFDLNIEKTKNINDLFLFTCELTCIANIYLSRNENNYQINDIINQSKILLEKCNELKNELNSDEKNILFTIIAEMANMLDISDQKKNVNLSKLFISVNSKKEDISRFETRALLEGGNIIEAKKNALKINDLELLEEIEWRSGNTQASFNYRFEQEKNNIYKIINSSKNLTDFEIEESRKNQKNILNFALGRYLINTEKPSNEIIKKSFELIINNYGLISSLNQSFFGFIRNSDPITKNEYLTLSKQNQETSLLNINGSEKYNQIREIEHNFNLKLITRIADTTEWISFQNIQNSLNDSTSFILNYKYVYNGFEGTNLNVTNTQTYYINFIILPNSRTPIIIIDSLISEKEEDLVDLYHSDVSEKKIKTDFSFVYDKIWSKVDEQIPSTIRTVLFNPDGIYNSVNVSTLFDKKNDKYIFEKYNVIIAKDNIFQKNQLSKAKTITVNSAVIIGNPNFSSTIIPNKIDSNDSLKINLSSYFSNSTRGTIVKTLPGTKIEVEKINNLLTQKGCATTLLMGNNASEENLKKIKAPDILHIATHGFFIEKKSMPMFNSGLLLAGCNNKTKQLDDGYLSAYETSLLNLENTKLVVLSACETGRGITKDGDGVFGLKQGCLNAGAQNIIMSLWKVDDKVTQEFMTRFYEIWLNDNTSIREAFNKTQLEIKAKYPQPYYWGAFILIGE